MSYPTFLYEDSNPCGGSGGLGSAVARSVANHGYKPIIGYLKNAGRAEALAADLDCPA
jgi:NAD(P)-dependent dehydrogenase (short-subunit alcohol dehydrogenase family)